jgi:hypothetical protein
MSTLKYEVASIASPESKDLIQGFLVGEIPQENFVEEAKKISPRLADVENHVGSKSELIAYWFRTDYLEAAIEQDVINNEEWSSFTRTLSAAAEELLA